MGIKLKTNYRRCWKFSDWKFNTNF